MRELGARKERNIEELEMDEAVAKALKSFTGEQP
jgi:hypothetical protein